MKKKLPMIGLITAPYLIIVVIMLCNVLGIDMNEEKLQPVLEVTAGLYQAFFGIMILLNMVWPFVLQKFGYTERKLFFWNMVIKLCYMPVYIVIFLFGLVSLVLPFGIMMVPILMIYDYIMLLPSTMYGFSGLICGRRKKHVSTKKLVVNIICQFMFCLDTISAVYLYVSACRQEKKE